MGERKQIPGQSRENFVYVFFSLFVFFSLKVPRTILQENPRQNPPKLYSKNPDTFLQKGQLNPNMIGASTQLRTPRGGRIGGDASPTPGGMSNIVMMLMINNEQ